jgi:ABC-2 type transport system permease protein
MRLLSEEKKQKTDQCLLTSPASLSGIVLGKYFAALAIYSLSLVTFLLYAVILAAFAEISWAVVIGNIIGAFLLGSSFIAVGLFVSSLTENQVIAAIGGFVAMMLLYVIDMISSLANNSTVQKIISSLAFYSKYYEFTTGVFNLLNVIFFVSASAIFIFLTVRVLEKKRWA